MMAYAAAIKVLPVRCVILVDEPWRGCWQNGRLIEHECVDRSGYSNDYSEEGFGTYGGRFCSVACAAEF